tara:strand:- start:740 stop:910 length:171 start_codon:yes stop_codon:yes gene_type:complete
MTTINVHEVESVEVEYDDFLGEYEEFRTIEIIVTKSDGKKVSVTLFTNNLKLVIGD